MPYCSHKYSFAIFTLPNFSASRPPRPRRRPSRGPGKNSLASQKELVRSAGPSAGPGQAVLRRKTVNATINPVEIERMVPRAGLSAAQPRSSAGLPRSRAAPGCRAATQPTRDRHCLSPSIHWGPPPAFRSHGGGRPGGRRKPASESSSRTRKIWQALNLAFPLLCQSVNLSVHHRPRPVAEAGPVEA